MSRHPLHLGAEPYPNDGVEALSLFSVVRVDLINLALSRKEEVVAARLKCKALLPARRRMGVLSVTHYFVVVLCRSEEGIVDW